MDKEESGILMVVKTLPLLEKGSWDLWILSCKVELGVLFDIVYGVHYFLDPLYMCSTSWSIALLSWMRVVVLIPCIYLVCNEVILLSIRYLLVWIYIIAMYLRWTYFCNSLFYYLSGIYITVDLIGYFLHTFLILYHGN